MGGLGGHMSHLYGDSDLKLSELTSIIQQVASGDIIYNEKADGQNIHVTMDTQRNVYFARNKGDITRMGRSALQIGQEYMEKDQSAQAEIFGDGCLVIEEVLKSLSDETMNMIFNDPMMPKTYVNCEIIHMDHPNLVLYDKYHIQFHEFKVDPNDEYPEVAQRYASKESRIQGLQIIDQKFAKFLQEVGNSEVTITGRFGNTAGKQMTFSIDGPQFLPPKTEQLQGEELELFAQQANNAIEQITSYVQSCGLSMDSSIGDLIIAQLEDTILPGLGIPDQILSDISHYIVYGTDASGVVIQTARATGATEDTLKPFKAKIAAALPGNKELVTKMTLGSHAGFRNGLINIVIKPLKEIIHNFSVSVLDGVESAIAKDPGLARYATAATLRDIDGLRRALESDYQDDPDRLARYMEKFDSELALLGDISKFNQSMEGVVINYVRQDGMPVLYKLTGLFAPANQIVGSSRSGFAIKRDLLTQARAEYRNEPYTPAPDPDIDGPSSPLQETIKRMIRMSIRRRLLR